MMKRAYAEALPIFGPAFHRWDGRPSRPPECNQPPCPRPPSVGSVVRGVVCPTP
jgi:hypothetical protein